MHIQGRGQQGPPSVCQTPVKGLPPPICPIFLNASIKYRRSAGEKDGSSGLGLYIVKTTAEAMGGSVRVESTLGKGTVFTVTFPAR